MTETSSHYAHINQPFGDGHYDFCLDWDSAVNWESKTEKSLYSTFVQMQRSGYFLLSDIREVIRLALIVSQRNGSKAASAGR